MEKSELANKLNIGEDIISYYESEHIEISLQDAIKYIKACGFDIRFVYKDKIYEDDKVKKVL